MLVLLIRFVDVMSCFGQEIAEIMHDDRVYAFLHIPVQAASNAVLGSMRREYTVEDFCRVVDVLREKVGSAAIIFL